MLAQATAAFLAAVFAGSRVIGLGEVRAGAIQNFREHVVVGVHLQELLLMRVILLSVAALSALCVGR